MSNLRKFNFKGTEQTYDNNDRIFFAREANQ